MHWKRWRIKETRSQALQYRYWCRCWRIRGSSSKKASATSPLRWLWLSRWRWGLIGSWSDSSSAASQSWDSRWSLPSLETWKPALSRQLWSSRGSLGRSCAREAARGSSSQAIIVICPRLSIIPSHHRLLKTLILILDDWIRFQCQPQLITSCAPWKLPSQCAPSSNPTIAIRCCSWRCQRSAWAVPS